jgi:hypothetical protein
MVSGVSRYCIARIAINISEAAVSIEADSSIVGMTFPLINPMSYATALTCRHVMKIDTAKTVKSTIKPNSSFTLILIFLHKRFTLPLLFLIYVNHEANYSKNEEIGAYLNLNSAGIKKGLSAKESPKEKLTDNQYGRVFRNLNS